MLAGKCKSVALGRQTLPPRRGNVRIRACPFKSILQSNSLDDMPFKFFHDKPYKLVLGLRQPDGDWLDVIDNDTVFVDELRQRRKHIQERRSAVLQLVDLPVAKEASRELLQQLLQQLPLQYPQRFRVDGPVIHNLVNGDAFDTSDPSLDPLEVAGLLVQEDFCIVAPLAEAPQGTAGAALGAHHHHQGAPDGTAGGAAATSPSAPLSVPYRMLGGVVCFPAHWSLLEKMGMDLATIHDPVPRWRTDASHLVHNFISKLPVENPLIRYNWTVLPTRELHLSRFFESELAAQEEAAAPPTSAEPLWLRIERQYFHRLPRSGAVVFTIRTYQQPLAQAVRGRPRAAEALAGALRSLPPEHLVYKSNLQVRLPALLELLDAAASAPATTHVAARAPV